MNFLYLYLKKKNPFSSIFSVGGFGGNISMSFQKHVLERDGICGIVQLEHLHLIVAFVPWSQAFS